MSKLFYPAVFHKAEEGGFWVSFPDLPECLTEGDNMEQAYAKAYSYGGVASGEHGIGISKRPYFLRETAQENLAVMNTIKTALDPKHILNDQKSYIVGGK